MHVRQTFLDICLRYNITPPHLPMNPKRNEMKQNSNSSGNRAQPIKRERLSKMEMGEYIFVCEVMPCFLSDFRAVHRERRSHATNCSLLIEHRLRVLNLLYTKSFICWEFVYINSCM